MKKVILLLLCLFLYACSAKAPVLNKSDAEEVLSFAKEYGFVETKREEAEDCTSVDLYGDVERADYYLTLWSYKDGGVMDMTLDAVGRMDRDFFYELFSLPLEHE